LGADNTVSSSSGSGGVVFISGSIGCVRKIGKKRGIAWCGDAREYGKVRICLFGFVGLTI
jgi:hypothetical protein